MRNTRVHLLVDNILPGTTGAARFCCEALVDYDQDTRQTLVSVFLFCVPLLQAPPSWKTSTRSDGVRAKVATYMYSYPSTETTG